jgi:hypothetical protein
MITGFWEIMLSSSVDRYRICEGTLDVGSLLNIFQYVSEVGRGKRFCFHVLHEYEHGLNS